MEAAELCREHGIRDVVYHNRKTKFSGMVLADVQTTKLNVFDRLNAFH